MLHVHVSQRHALQPQPATLEGHPSTGNNPKEHRVTWKALSCYRKLKGPLIRSGHLTMQRRLSQALLLHLPLQRKHSFLRPISPSFAGQAHPPLQAVHPSSPGSGEPPSCSTSLGSCSDSDTKPTGASTRPWCWPGLRVSGLDSCLPETQASSNSCHPGPMCKNWSLAPNIYLAPSLFHFSTWHILTTTKTKTYSALAKQVILDPFNRSS